MHFLHEAYKILQKYCIILQDLTRILQEIYFSATRGLSLKFILNWVANSVFDFWRIVSAIFLGQ